MQKLGGKNKKTTVKQQW